MAILWRTAFYISGLRVVLIPLLRDLGIRSQ